MAGWLVVQIVTQVFPIFEVSALAQRIIVLVIVAGFPITLILTWLFDITPKGIVRTDDLPATGESHAMQRERVGMDRKMNYVLALLLVTAIGYFVLDRTVLRRDSAQATSNAKSIAVLPLVNTSGDAANDYFSMAVGGTYRCPRKIPPQDYRRSSCSCSKASPTTEDIGEKLGVAKVREGSVRKQGPRAHRRRTINAAEGARLVRTYTAS